MIQEGNNLIAKFMGAKLVPHPTVNCKEWTGYTPIEGLLQSTTLHFHDDWNWLMPVVEKIEKEKHPVFISSNNCTIYERTGKNHGFIIDKYGISKINACWQAIIQFIKWYNEQAKTQNQGS